MYYLVHKNNSLIVCSFPSHIGSFHFCLISVLTDKHGEESIVKMIERVEMLTLELESATVTEERGSYIIS